MKEVFCKKVLPAVAAGIFFGAAMVSAVHFSLKQKTERHVLYFASYDTPKICTEVRHLPLHPVQGREAAFVDELLLGPMTNRYKRLFAHGTRAEFCFREGHTLHVGLSEEALYPDAEAYDIRKGVELLRANIVRNFTKINSVEVYIAGKSVWETTERS